MIPKNRAPTHPGEMLLEEFLKPIGMSQKKFAEHLGWTYAKLNELIHAKRGITPATALDLGDVFNMEPEFWMNLQKDWELYHAKFHHIKVKFLGVKILKASAAA